VAHNRLSPLMWHCCAARNTKDAVGELVRATLSDLAESGFSDTAIEAAMNTIEFSLRENNTGSFPRGLSLMLRAMGSWLYDRDPFQPLQWTADLERFKVRMRQRTPDSHPNTAKK
jgi:Zn-dependent M16 (insulinase) family peptidase